MPQVPTARGVKIRSAADAHLLFYAVHLGRLPMIQRRLDATERQEVVSGAVFVWEERSAASTSQTSVDDGQSAPEPGASPNVVSGIERWTDGLKWGPSRVRDDFLFYQEKDPNDKESLISPPPVLAHSSHGPYRSQAGKHGAKLIKQTYSVHYYPQILEGKPPTEPARKWHLTAYHSVQTVDRLADVMAIPELHDLSAPPDGLFKKARVGKKPGGASSVPPVASPSTSRAPIVRTASDNWQDGASSSSQGPFTPSTEATYGIPQSRTVHHPTAATQSPGPLRYGPHAYTHAPHHQHARSMSVGYNVDTLPHYAHPHPPPRSNSMSEQYPAQYHTYDYSRPPAQYPNYYPGEPYYGYHSRSQSYNGPPPFPYPPHPPPAHHPPYYREPAMTQPDSPSEMHMARRMSYPLPPAPQTYDHPFAYQPPPLTPAQADAPTQQLPTPPAQSPDHRYAVPASAHSAPPNAYYATYDSASGSVDAYGSPNPVRSPPSGVVRTGRKLRRSDEESRGSVDARSSHFSPYGRPVNHPGPRQHLAQSSGHFDPFHPPPVEPGQQSRPSSIPGNTYLPRPAGTQPVGPQYTYEHDPSGPGQWSTEPTPGAVQTQSAYPISEGRTQFRHSTTSENETPPQPTTGGHFQPQLEPLANPDGSPPFTHFRSSSGTDIANVTGASPDGSTSSTGQLASARVPPPSIPAKLDMNMTGGSVTSQTSATSVTGAGVSSKLGPLTPSTHHQRDPHDERVLELLSRVATGTTTPVATASGQTGEGETVESND